MGRLYKYKSNDLNILFEVDERDFIRLLHLSTLPFPDADKLDEARKKAACIVEMQVTGMDCPGHKGIKLADTEPGHLLKFKSIVENDDEIIVKQFIKDALDLEVETHFKKYRKINILKIWSNIKNNSAESIGLEYVSSLNIVGVNNSGFVKHESYTNNILYIPHNSWTGEVQWERKTLAECGLLYAIDGEKNQSSTKVISAVNNSGWSSSQYSPSAILENPLCGMSCFWQIENNGAWYWELTDSAKGKELALRAGGPTELYNHWWKNLRPNQSFTTVPVAFGCVSGSWESAVQELTKYRRVIRRKNDDNINLPVIFNDYMNCLSGDPTTEKLLPLIHAAKEVGCEYFVIDCGWYDDGYWWDNVGEWKPSLKRFPGGLKAVVDEIRSCGMVAGLWLEIEVMGIKSKLAASLPDDWFFMRHNKRIIDNGRYQLDFRNSSVRRYASEVIDRLINDYGIGYIKMDFNSTGGIGTEINSDSYGDGLLEHNRAYLSWLDEIFAKYPDLVIENCGSGGMRHDYQMLARHSIQSVSDQTDYLVNGAIAAGAASWVTPEQAAVWSYPLRCGDVEEVIFNMVNAMLLRIHQSGHLAELTPERLHYVKEGIDVYKSLRAQINRALPVWFTGIPKIGDDWFSYGLDCGDCIYLAVWRYGGDKDILPISLPEEYKIATQIYPKESAVSDKNTDYLMQGKSFVVNFKRKNIARLYKISK